MNHRRVKTEDLRCDGRLMFLSGEPVHTDGLEEDIAERGVWVLVIVSLGFFIVDGCWWFGVVGGV